VVILGMCSVLRPLILLVSFLDNGHVGNSMVHAHVIQNLHGRFALQRCRLRFLRLGNRGFLNLAEEVVIISSKIGAML
jgi:hypothetical protein